MIEVFCALVVLSFVAAGAPARGQPQLQRQGHKSIDASSPRLRRLPRRVKPTPEAGGLHWRLSTAQGPIHVWQPKGYRRANAGIVLYVHGYNINVDRAWRHFRLAAQFYASRQNALFIVPEVPQSMTDRLSWENLPALLRRVSAAINQKCPAGHVVVLAHSGGYRTAAAWLTYPALDHVILLDALYGNEAEFEHWLEEDERRYQHKLIIVASDTKNRSQALAKKIPYGRMRSSIPRGVSALSTRERRVRLLYFDSQFGHNQMIENGKVLPLLLRLTRLNRR